MLQSDINGIVDYALLENEMIERGFLQRLKNHIRPFSEHAYEDMDNLIFKYSNQGLIPYPF